MWHRESLLVIFRDGEELLPQAIAREDDSKGSPLCIHPSVKGSFPQQGTQILRVEVKKERRESQEGEKETTWSRTHWQNRGLLDRKGQIIKFQLQNSLLVHWKWSPQIWNNYWHPVYIKSIKSFYKTLCLDSNSCQYKSLWKFVLNDYDFRFF